MSADIRESDWKMFRQLHPIVRDRFCESVLREIARVASNAAKRPHERDLEIFELLRKRDRLLGDAFDNPRRSTGFVSARAYPFPRFTHRRGERSLQPWNTRNLHFARTHLTTDTSHTTKGHNYEELQSTLEHVALDHFRARHGSMRRYRN